MQEKSFFNLYNCIFFSNFAVVMAYFLPNCLMNYKPNKLRKI